LTKKQLFYIIKSVNEKVKQLAQIFRTFKPLKHEVKKISDNIYILFVRHLSYIEKFIQI